MSDRPRAPAANTPEKAAGRLAENIVYFARALRAAGIPVGPGAVLDALEAVQAAGVGTRDDFYWTLHAVFVKRHEHTVLFDQAFRIFFRRRAYLERLMAMMMPQAPTAAATKAVSQRVQEALFSGLDDKLKRERQIELDTRMTVSDREVLQKKDFAQMTNAEMIAAKDQALGRKEHYTGEIEHKSSEIGGRLPSVAAKLIHLIRRRFDQQR